MAPLTDPTLIALIREALSEWKIVGFVVWKPLAREWLAKNLTGQTQESVTYLLHQHVDAGGIIDRQVETRELHRDRYREHFDFRLLIGGRKIYIESTLDQTSTGPIVTIVNIHDA
jgi:hypothetical protein